MMFDSDARSAGEAELQTHNAADGSSNEALSVGSTRYRDKAMSWLALGALLATWHMPSRVDRPSEVTRPRIDARSTTPGEQLWIRRATEARSWIARVPHGVARTARAGSTQPEWSALASVRTARRWLDNR